MPIGSSAGYLSTEGGAAGKLIKMDLATGAKVAVAAMPASGYLLASPDGATLYLYGNDQLYAIDVATLKVKNSAPPVCRSLAATPDGEYLCRSTASGVDILATSTLEVIGSIPSPAVDSFPGAPIVITK